MKKLLKRLNIFDKLKGVNRIATQKEGDTSVKVSDGTIRKPGEYNVNREF